VNVASIPAEGTAGIKFAGTASKAVTEKPEVLEPRTEGKAGCGLERLPQLEEDQSKREHEPNWLLKVRGRNLGRILSY